MTKKKKKILKSGRKKENAGQKDGNINQLAKEKIK